MNQFTRTLGPTKYASMDTIPKCISKRTTYKGWKFSSTSPVNSSYISLRNEPVPN